MGAVAMHIELKSRGLHDTMYSRFQMSGKLSTGRWIDWYTGDRLGGQGNQGSSGPH